MAGGKSVGSYWNSLRNLVFHDKSRNTIFTVDGVNRQVTFPSGSKLSLTGATFVTPTGQLDFYTADGQDETMTAAITITPVGSAPAIVATDEVVLAMVYTTKASIASQALRDKADFTCGAGTITVGANAANNTNNQYLFGIVHHA